MIQMEEAEFSKPLHIQRLEQAFKLDPFLNYVEHIINQPISDYDTASESEAEGGISIKNGIPRTKDERENDKSHLYNFSCIRRKRQWLKETLVSSSSSSESSESEDGEDDGGSRFTTADLEKMLREHRLRKHHQSHFYQNEENRGYLYYSAGLLSRVDKYPDHQRFMAGSRRKKNKEKREKEKLQKIKKEEDEEDFDPESPLAQNEDSLHSFPDDTSDDLTVPVKGRNRSNKKDKKPKKLDAQALTMRRHKLWVLMAKKEVGRCQKSKASFRKEVLQNCKRMATGCMRVCRQKALQSQKTVKDKVWMLKRLTRTMQGEWKKFDRILKEQNRRAEREAEEQRKMDKEILEVKRQQRKVNFLITLPELYAHFMKNKMGSASLEDEDTSSILKQLEDDGSMPSSSIDDYDCEAMKVQALKTAQEAYSTQQAKLSFFSGTEGKIIPGLEGSKESKEHPQPDIFTGILKSYQLNGMNWLANLYYFGINGILADEMGLGKTVQSIAFLAHICEQYDTWGPFLIITPASTLHNWTGEIARFVPNFQVVPYWGNPEERKNLRKFFDGKNLGSRDASFHIVVTSYQIVIQDFKFLNRLKWNYMVLDEAQAIKSINSQRWKLLLGFSCRNRLLLSGTPIQNSMAELWALLHFIMPTLFDSHLWFNEWFSKDIEGHVENKTHVDEKHLNRLHMILKPFMLRRVKTEVENELTDKIEIMMYCPLTLRQKFLYSGLKNKISIDELLRSSMGPSSQQSSVTSSLMNLVMQFRKVCNHPELLERREVRSPYTTRPEPYLIPKLVFREAFFLDASPSKHHLLYNRFSVFHADYVHSSLTKENETRKCFSFLRFMNVSVQELSDAVLRGLVSRWLMLYAALQYANIRYLRNTWNERVKTRCSQTLPASKDQILVDPVLCPARISSSEVLTDLMFTSSTSSIYTFSNHTIHHIPETMNHRIIRSKKARMPLIEEVSETSYICDNENTPCDLLTVIPDEDSSTLPAVPDLKVGFGKVCTPQKIGHSQKMGSPQKIGGGHKHSHRRTSTGLKHSSKKHIEKKEVKIGDGEEVESGEAEVSLLPEMPHVERPPIIRTCQPTFLPTFLLHTCSKAQCLEKEVVCHDRSAAWWRVRAAHSDTAEGLSYLIYGSSQLEKEWTERRQRVTAVDSGGLRGAHPKLGWSHVLIPDKHTLIMDAGKLYVLDTLLSRLKAEGHRVLIYSQMTKMIDVLEVSTCSN
ncbi:chromatin-remodeling ATPase INO80-like [Homarus americanus]|uniref:chromatin-remodeling ATPase INO80-like n=1 Tax=Homarus americanus TaxID=6706 RepID=UPI001C48C1EC|nr:chromatin-remodeling ATPase INO80-like [Homarus americanus]